MKPVIIFFQNTKEKENEKRKANADGQFPMMHFKIQLKIKQ